MNKEGRKRGRSDRCDVLWPKTRLGCRGSCWGGRSFPLVGSALGVWGVNPALCPLPSLVTVHTPLPGRSSFFRASLKSLMAFCGSFLPPPQRLCFLFSLGKEKLAPSPPTAVVLLSRWEPFGGFPSGLSGPAALLTFLLALSLSCIWPADAFEMPSALAELFVRFPPGPLKCLLPFSSTPFPRALCLPLLQQAFPGRNLFFLLA